MSVYSVASGVKGYGSTGTSAGQVGIVLSVDEEDGTFTVIQSGSGFHTETQNTKISTYDFPTSDVITFTYIGDYLK